MRWPFRTKHSDPPPDHSTPGDSAASGYASSVRRTEWASLPPAPVAIAVRAPRTIVGSTSAIRRPIGLRELTDITDAAAVGLVDGIVGVVPVAAHASWRPEAPVGEPSALPDVVTRTLRHIDGGARGSLTTIESVAVVAVSPVVPPETSARPSSRPTTDSDDEGFVHAPRSSLAQSRRLGLGPGYHGALPDAIRQEHLDRTGTDEHDGAGAEGDDESAERVPDDLRTIIRDAYGHDVGDQLVQRGPEVTDEARRLGARAFARDGDVFVPIEEGPLDQAHAKSLLAHELTHLVQQRRRSAPLPADGSPEAQALEAEAQRAERFVRGDPGAPAPGAMSTAASGPDDFADTRRFVNELVHRGVAEPDGTGGIRFLWGRGGGHVQRAVEPAGTPTPDQNKDAGTSALRAFGSSIASEFEEKFLGEFSFITGLEEELKATPDAVEPDHIRQQRELRRKQTKDEFARLRLDHHRAAKRSETGGVALTEDQDLELRNEINAEVRRREEALDLRVKTHLDQVNEQLRGADQNEQRELDPDRVDAIFNKLFAQPDGELPPDDTSVEIKAYAESVAKSKTGAPKVAPPGQGGMPGTGGTPAEATTPAVTPPGQGTPGTGGGGGGGIDSFSALGRALVTDLAVLEAGEFGVTLSDDELKSMWSPTGAKAATPTTTPPTTPTPGGTSDTKHIGPSGHEKIDLDRIDFEELSKRLFPRLRSSLRQELLVDRERSGRLNH
jgi:hypothetical protein